MFIKEKIDVFSELQIQKHCTKKSNSYQSQYGIGVTLNYATDTF